MQTILILGEGVLMVFLGVDLWPVGVLQQNPIYGLTPGKYTPMHPFSTTADLQIERLQVWRNRHARDPRSPPVLQTTSDPPIPRPVMHGRGVPEWVA